MARKQSINPSRITGQRSLDRRAFLGRLGSGATASLALGSLPSLTGGGAVRAEEIDPLGSDDRREAALRIRMDAARFAYERPYPDHAGNGDEDLYPARIGSYSKALPHNALGEVDGTAYGALLAALDSGDPDEFERIPLGLERRLSSPQAGLAFDLEGPDAHHTSIPPAPAFASAEEAAEAGELYWMALLRDLSFNRFDHDRRVEEAAEDMSHFSDFRGPKEGPVVTPAMLFRGSTPGDLAGPYVSQFLLRDVPYGSLTISQRQQTVRPKDYVTEYASWLNVQNGGPGGALALDPRRRYIRNMRDLTHYVHLDALYEAYLNACLILLGAGAPLNSGNPYRDSKTQIGFATFGPPHLLSLLTEVASRALKCVWYQKWYVHRRLRPEEFGGRVHNQMSGTASYPVHSDILNCRALELTRVKHGTWLLPQAYPEGCPTHPSYGSGHATVGGACVTILKAWFDETFVLADPVTANEDGSALVPYAGPGAGSLSVGGELNKLASNIASARNMAGIHWRSDYRASLDLGEAVAIGILEEQKGTYNERAGFTFSRFDGTRITL